jgi:PIN domain nuclease of toxin-antitoxin system
VASLWEIAIKTNLGKLTLSKPFAELIPQQLADNNIMVMAISLDDLNEVASLPLHHRDPFDRLLVAQVISRGMPQISDDRNFAPYSITLVQ